LISINMSAAADEQPQHCASRSAGSLQRYRMHLAGIQIEVRGLIVHYQARGTILI